MNTPLKPESHSNHLHKLPSIRFSLFDTEENWNKSSQTMICAAEVSLWWKNNFLEGFFDSVLEQIKSASLFELNIWIRFMKLVRI